MNVFAPFRDYIAALVHPSARRDPLTTARHRAFIGSRILLGLIALAAFPLYLFLNGVPGALEAFFFAWMLLPILNAYYLSSSGRYEVAHVLASRIRARDGVAHESLASLSGQGGRGLGA